MFFCKAVVGTHVSHKVNNFEARRKEKKFVCERESIVGFFAFHIFYMLVFCYFFSSDIDPSLHHHQKRSLGKKMMKQW